MINREIETSYPLNFMQQTLLIHHLYHKHEDQGFLQVRCKLKGPLNRDLFQESWNRVAALHSAFRTSFHWDKDEPVQVIHPTADLKMHYRDWGSKPLSDIPQLEEQLKREDQQMGLDLSKVPITRLNLIKLPSDEHLLFWTCHHILFDGWSGAVVLEDVFECYHSLSINGQVQLVSNSGYGDYVNWKTGIDLKEAQKFWVQYLKGFHTPALIAKADSAIAQKFVFVEEVIQLSEKKSTDLRGMLSRNRVTFNTYLRSIWALLLGKICDSGDVVFGATVSGRMGNIMQLERMVGLFMNVLPVRIRLQPDQSFKDFMLTTQSQQLAANNYDHITQDLITSWLKWPSHLPLYDSLIVTQNLSIRELKAGDLAVVEAEGKITSIHPLTIIAEPKDCLTIILRYNSILINKGLIRWIANNLLTLTDNLIDNSELNLAQIRSSIFDFEVNNINHLASRPSKKSREQINSEKVRYLPPSSDAELKLTKLWEATLGIYPIGVNDNFFDIGGKSLQAVKLFSLIHETTGKNLSPSMLIKFPTIAKLAREWDENNSQSSWDSLVPLRASGSKPPLFAIHGGGGHVFFHQPMARHLDPDQPVFALQPEGLDHEKWKYQSIPELASHYLKVIRRVRPKGSFSILGTCLSDPICIEINNQMRQQGEIPIAIIIVDSAPSHFFPRNIIRTPKKVRLERFRERFTKSPYQAIRKIFADRFKRAIKPLKLKWNELKIQYGSDKQERILLNLGKQLQKMFYQYQWQPFEGKITLIRTSQNAARINNHDDEVWAKLASEKVDVLIIPGNHNQRFEEPNVIELSKQLQNYLDRLYQKR